MSYSDLIPPSVSDSIPSAVRVELSKQPPERQDQFVEEYRRKAKNMGIAYLLCYVMVSRIPLSVLW